MDPLSAEAAAQLGKALAQAQNTQQVLAIMCGVFFGLFMASMILWRIEVKSRLDMEAKFRSESVGLVREQVGLTARVVQAVEYLSRIHGGRGSDSGARANE